MTLASRRGIQHSIALALTLALVTPAHADPTKDITKRLGEVLWTGGPSAWSRFAFTSSGVNELGSKDTDSLAMNNVDAKQVVVGVSGIDAFVAADLILTGDCGGGPNCGKELGMMHAAILFEKDADNGWLPVVWHTADVLTPRDARRIGAPAAIARKVDGAPDVARLFESTLDPRAFAKTVSDRKEVVLYGSERAERYVGGAAVRAKLIAWNLALTTRDGVQVGLSKGKSLAWAAANVDARSLKNPKAPAVPYRLLVIYEKEGTAWKAVSISFSVHVQRG